MIIQPMDFLKVRMQLSGEGGVKRDHLNSFQAIKNIVRNEGFLSLYSGLTANLFRQATYTTSRLAIYQATIEELNRSDLKYHFRLDLICVYILEFIDGLFSLINSKYYFFLSEYACKFLHK